MQSNPYHQRKSTCLKGYDYPRRSSLLPKRIDRRPGIGGYGVRPGFARLCGGGRGAGAGGAASLEAGYSLQAGEILVTSFTYVVWTPIFSQVAAIVTDVGAALSQTTIVARNLGIPAVLGCGDATRRLKTGERLRGVAGRGLWSYWIKNPGFLGETWVL